MAKGKGPDVPDSDKNPGTIPEGFDVSKSEEEMAEDSDAVAAALDRRGQKPKEAVQRVVKENLRNLAKMVAHPDFFERNWPLDDEAKREVTIKGPTVFGVIEKRKITGNYVYFREEGNGKRSFRINRDTPVSIAADPADVSSPHRMLVGGEVFIRVIANGKKGYIAEQFLMPMEEKTERIVHAKETGHGDVETHFRDVVIFELRKSRMPDEIINVRYKAWDDAYQALRKERGKISPAAFDAKLQKIFEETTGSSENIYQATARVEMAMGLYRKHLVVPEGKGFSEKAFDRLLAKAGDEVGLFFGLGRKASSVEIKKIFGLVDNGKLYGVPENFWKPGAEIVFNSKNGFLYFYAPKGERKMEMIDEMIPGKAPVQREQALAVKPAIPAYREAANQGKDMVASLNRNYLSEMQQGMAYVRGDEEQRRFEQAFAGAKSGVVPEQALASLKHDDIGTTASIGKRPEIGQAAMAETAEAKTYTVKAGDNIQTIARRFYGKDVNLKFALALQKESLGTVKFLKSGKVSFIHPGDVIKLPKSFLGRERKE